MDSSQAQILTSSDLQGKGGRIFRVFLKVGILLSPWFYLRYGGFDFTVGSSLTAGDMFLVAALGVAFLKYLTVGLPTRPRLVEGMYVTAAFSLVAVLSGVAGVVGVFELTDFNLFSFFTALLQYVFIMAGFCLLAGLVHNAHRMLVLVCVAYLAPLAVTILLAAMGEINSQTSWFFSVNRAIGSYGNANSFGSVILIVFPLYIYLWGSNLNYWERRLGIVGAVCSIVCLFLTVSFSAWLVFSTVLFLNVALMFLVRRHPFRRYRIRAVIYLVAAGAVLTGFLVVFLSLFPEIFNAVSVRLLVNSDAEVGLDTLGSGSERVELMELALSEIGDRWGGVLFGHGLSQSIYYPSFNMGGIQVVVHNMPLLLWLETGLLGLVLIYWFIAILMRELAANLSYEPLLSLMLMNSILMLLVYSLFNPHMYLRYFWVPLLPAFVVLCRPQRVPCD